MVRVSVFVAILLILPGPLAMAAESLCPNRAPIPEGADDLRMQEEEFTLEHALKSLEFLRTDFASRIWGPDAVTDFTASSGHYISYANSLKFIEGALLKQEVLLQRGPEKELSTAAPNSAIALEAEQSLRVATEKFCNFIQSAEYVD